MAEKVGFEPTEPRGSDALQAPAFDHSATSPLNGEYYIIACPVCQTRKQNFSKPAKTLFLFVCSATRIFSSVGHSMAFIKSSEKY